MRHGGLLGLKYMLAIAVQKNMVTQLLPQALPWVMKGLQDVDDDIRGLAAASLLPVSEVRIVRPFVRYLSVSSHATLFMNIRDIR